MALSSTNKATLKSEVAQVVLLLDNLRFVIGSWDNPQVSKERKPVLHMIPE